jgi:hypothetical protein
MKIKKIELLDITEKIFVVNHLFLNIEKDNE